LPGVSSAAIASEKRASHSKHRWPETRSEQAGAVHAAPVAVPGSASTNDLARSFGRATDGRVERVPENFETWKRRETHAS
jgi:hypothetical protein